MQNLKIPFIYSLAFICLTALSANAKVEIYTLPNGDVSISPHNSNNGCTVLYDKNGKLVNKGSSCKFGDVLVAGLSMQAHLKEKLKLQYLKVNLLTEKQAVQIFGKFMV